MATPTPTSAPLATAPTHAPTVSGSVVIDWGSFVAQLLSHETPIVEAVAAGGVALALSAVPMGSFISNFIGPKLVSQYVDMALTAVEGGVSGQSITLPSGGIGGFVAKMAANLFTQGEPQLVSFLDADVMPWIEAELKARGI